MDGVPVPYVDRVTIFREDRIIRVYRGFPISHVRLTTGHWVYDVIDPQYRKVATVLSEGAAQVWIDDVLQPK